MPEETVSAVIVNWNTCELLGRCLASLLSAAKAPDEIVVVDNASSDSSAQMVRRDFPTVTLITNEVNRMYAAANNPGIAASRGKYVWLLNPDTEVAGTTFSVLSSFLDSHPDAAAVACKLVYSNTYEVVTRPGAFFTMTSEVKLPDHQLSVRTFPTPAALWFEALGLARLFPRSKLFGQYRMGWWNYDDVREVDQPMTSCLMLRRAALDQVGLFDEGFPLFFNDVDLCYRLRKAGWKVCFTPETEVVHHVGASTKQIGARAIRESHESLLRFYRKHYAGPMNPLVYQATCALIKLSGWARSLRRR